MLFSLGRMKLIGAAALVVGLLAAAVAIAPPPDPGVKPYLAPVGAGYEIKPILSVGDTVPQTGGAAGSEYQMVGIPDGLGAHANGDGTMTVYMNHEFTAGTLSEPLVGRPQNRGALVSKLMLDSKGTVLSGDRAYDTVYLRDTLVGPAPDVTNATPAFGRLCSGNLGTPADGFDRYIYFAGEESGGAGTFSGVGGQAVAIFDNELHVIPEMGRLPFENLVVRPNSQGLTVVLILEDGPTTPDSQLYMYVGKKDLGPIASPLARNGLTGGKLFVFAGNDAAANSETALQEGSTTGRWVEIFGAASMTDVELEAAADAAGAFGFIRIEDGAFGTTNNNDFFFVTTGGNAGLGNGLGRLYHLRLDGLSMPKQAMLTVVYNADRVIAAGGDTAISPDNLDVSADYLMINEDGTADSRPVMAAKGRDGSIWRFNVVTTAGGYFTTVDASSATRVAELDPPGRDGAAVNPGVWETSGIIDTASLWGSNSWLVDVQAHSPTVAPGVNTVEDGQLLLMTPVSGLIGVIRRLTS